MPYLKSERKEQLKLGAVPATPGDLNYLFTKLILEYLDNNGLSYYTINDVVGALECCKQEFYQRLVVPYERLKARTNGDVYEYHSIS